MKSESLIRPMTLEDLDTILEIEKEVFSEPWSRRSYEFEVKRNRFAITVVLEYQQQIIGYAVSWKIYSEFHIASISIIPDYQGQGWGKYLLNSLLAMAGDAKTALLEVRKSNLKAITLYEKSGFSTVMARPRYYHNGEDALVMKKRLKE